MSENKQTIYNGKIISLDVEQVVLPNSVEVEMEIVRHPGGAVVVALDEKSQVCLLRQYRHVCNGWIWELPAGKIDNKEDPLITARRELEEEAGKTAEVWHSLGDMISSPGVFTEVVHCYLATGLSNCDVRHEAEELIEIHWLPLQQVYEWAISNRISDAKSVVSICRAQAMFT